MSLPEYFTFPLTFYPVKLSDQDAVQQNIQRAHWECGQSLLLVCLK